MTGFGLSTGFLRVSSLDSLAGFFREACIGDLEIWEQDGLFPSLKNPETVRSILENAGLRVGSVHAPFLPGAFCPNNVRELFLARFEECCARARAYGASYVVVHPHVLEGESPDLFDLKRTAPGSLKLWERMAGSAAASGLKTAFENIPAGAGWPEGCGWRTVRDIARVLGEGNAGTCLDLSHAFANDEWPELDALLASEPPPLGIHVSDGITGSGRDLHLPPGEGDMKWSPFLSGLEERGYEGRLVIETNSPYLSACLAGEIVRFLREKSGKNHYKERI